MECSELIKLAKGNRSNRQFGLDSGIAPSYINGLEKGKYEPSLKIILKICDASQKRVTVKDFIGLDVNGKAEKLYEFCMSVIKDETERKLVDMYYRELER